MEMVIPHDKYTLNPSTKTITLLDPYDDVTLERINLIYNLSTQAEIYNSANPRKHRLFKSGSDQIGTDITVSNGVITYIEETSMLNTNVLKIIIDTAVVTATGGVGSSSVLIVDPVNFLYQESIAASGTLDTDTLDTRSCTKLNIYFSNTGTSTDVKITVKGSPTSDKTLYKIIGDPIQLGAGESSGPVIGDDEIPGYIWFTIENNDTSNSAIITITIDRYVGSYTQTNTTLFSGQSVSYGTPATSNDVYAAASRRVNIYCSQSGTSTNTTFDIYGKSKQSPNITKLLATCNLGVAGQWGCGLLQDIIPGSVYALVTNFDSIHTATATVLIESFT